MSKKILITQKQALQFNKMLQALKTISKGYQTPEQLRRNSKNDFGLGYEEAMGMAYENIQTAAKEAAKNVKTIQPV